ncbi:hypothetical protein ACOSP7_032366 [Xanthoceras sorbifolium]|uniref:U-box domain-containing protein n=1 Tax=Xanthoceras sorbifolium TaxID=99658 RepID=A0ABQ8H4Q6_9ROSI|nr:hypothetical protein JRO89_XS14G0088300 [Xanthoceras sorbifolium]
MSSEEISLNGLNSQLVFQEDALRSFGCHQHHHHRGSGVGGGDPGPKTRELTGFIEDKMFSSVDRDRYFRPQPAIFADHPPDRHRDHPQQQEPRNWSNGHALAAASPTTDESDEDDDDEDDEDEDEVDEAENNKKNSNKSNNMNSNSTNCNNNNNSTNCSVAISVGEDKMGNGKAKQLSNNFGKNGNVIQTVNSGALVTVAEADGDLYYSQYLQGTTEGSSGSGQKECVVVDNGCGISGSGDSLRAILADPVTGALMDDAMILPCGHSFGAAGIQHINRTKACFTCSRPVLEDSIAPNLSLRAAVQAFRREEELQYYRSCKRRRERFDQDKGSFGDSTLNDPPRGRGVQFPFAVTDRVIIKGNKRTPQRFVGREAVVTTQCLNGWYVVKTLDNAESVKLQYRSLAKVPDNSSSKPIASKMPPNWL